jgi:peptide/nickel transport system permease protein
MSRAQFIARRLVQMIPVVFFITIVVFMLLRLIPGDPVTAVLGERATDEDIARVRGEMGLDRPIWVQYGYYMRDLAQFDLGESSRFDVPVTEILPRRLRVTLSLAIYTTVLTNLIALPLGILSAIKKDSLLDNIVRSGLIVAMVMPSFWVGILFIIFFSIKLGLFPVAGFGDSLAENVHHLFLPALTISLGLAAVLIRSLRSSILDTMQTEYVKTARAKGLSNQSVITAHVLRNALVPYVTLLGIHIAFLLAGTVIVEKVFALPGAGALLIDSVAARDYSMVQALTLIFALLVIGANLITDLLYSFLDPRVRFS